MALPLGKLTLLIGAGVIGSILASEGRMPSVSDMVSGALKAALKPIKQSDSASSTNKPRNDALVSQVNSLRQELQLLASSRPVTIVTSSARGGRRYGVIIVIVVIGYGYVWWKGWKLPDFMFATKRSLNDASNSVAKELDKVHGSITATKDSLSSKLDSSSDKFEDIVTCTIDTKKEVTEVHGKVSKFRVNLQSINHQIRTLETKMGRIQDKQDETKQGVGKLLLCTVDADNKLKDLIQAMDSPSTASRPALDYPQITASSRTGSLPAGLQLEPPSPSSSNGSSEVNGRMRTANLASGSRERQGISGAVEELSSVSNGNGNHASEVTVNPASPELSPRQPVRSAGLLSRTISVTQYFKFK